MVPVAPIFTSITYAFTFHMHLIAVIRSLHFQMFPAAFLFTFLSPKIATSINMHSPFFIITDYDVRFIIRLLLLLLLLLLF